MKNHIICLGVLLAASAGAYYIGAHYNCPAKTTTNCISPERCSLRTNMRKLWSDHVWWTRDYLIAAIADMPELKDTTNRLLKNQVDIGDAVAAYYGKEAGAKLSALLKEHILIAADVVAAAKANDAAKLKDANTKWYANADEIAAFLSSANSNWPKSDLEHMMHMHLQLTTDEAVARIKKDWAADIKAFEKVFDEIMKMSDELTTGIVKQFPNKF